MRVQASTTIAAHTWRSTCTANIIAALWPERCKAMVSVSGYLIVTFPMAICAPNSEACAPIESGQDRLLDPQRIHQGDGVDGANGSTTAAAGFSAPRPSAPPLPKSAGIVDLGHGKSPCVISLYRSIARLLARIVGGIQIIEAKRTDGRYLRDVFAGFRPVKMRSVAGYHDYASRWKSVHLVAVKTIAET